MIMVGIRESVSELLLGWDKGLYYECFSNKDIGDRSIIKTLSYLAEGYASSDLYVSKRGKGISDFLSGI